jgi:mono/diheme cytochrome c family protein
MPAWRDVLTAPDIEAVAAYVKKAFARTGPSR